MMSDGWIVQQLRLWDWNAESAPIVWEKRIRNIDLLDDPESAIDIEFDLTRFTYGTNLDSQFEGLDYTDSDTMIAVYGDDIARAVAMHKERFERSQPVGTDRQIADAVHKAVSESTAPNTSLPAADRDKRTPEGKIAKTQTRSEGTDTSDSAAVERTAAEIAKSMGVNLSSAGKNGLEGLVKLFGGKGKASSGLSFDEESYAEAKPYFQAVLTDMEKVGDDIMDFIAKMVKEFGAGIEPYLLRFAADQRGSQNDISQSNDLERNSGDPTSQAPQAARTDEDGVRGTAGSPGSDGRGTGVRGGLAEGDARVRDGGAPTAGERGNQSLHSDEGQRLLEGSPAGSGNDGRSTVPGNLGVPPERSGAGESGKSDTKVQQYQAKLKAQKEANKLPVVKADTDNINASLPFLFDGQRKDVEFAETRFAKDDGYGVLFTNGTGTGKTYTGLGIVRRFVSQGRENILIVAPTAKVIGDWIKAGKDLGLDITKLIDTRDAGTGVVITTYANMRDNDSLSSRDWDLVVNDESHYLIQNAAGGATANLNAVRALTLHPDGIMHRTRMLYPDLTAKIEGLQAVRNKTTAQDAELETALTDLNAKRDEVQTDVLSRQGQARPRLLALSATPFAYERTIEWGNGYLFNYNDGRPDSEGRRGYNEPDNEQAFFIQHFGYRMRINKLTEPDHRVDRGLMQRQFNTWLKKQKVLSNRTLDVESDYDRRFILIDSKIGNKVDALLDWLNQSDDSLSREQKSVKSAMNGMIRDQFDHLSRRYFLEAIKAEASVAIVKEHMALGRKVLVFHDFKLGGGFNPFIITAESVSTINSNSMVVIRSVLAIYNEMFSDVITADFGSSRSPINTFRAEFPDVLLYNGDVPARIRAQNADKFNDDATGAQVMLAQSAAAKEGISLHDTTGNHQRVGLNLGLPTQPTTAIQQEGRLYRIGQASNAIFRYMNTGTSWERWAFATTIAERASAAENLAQGEQARALKDAFITGFMESDRYPAGMEGEGTGGKELDAAANNALTEFDRAVAFYYGTQKKNARNKAAEGKDYFATPEPLGLKMMEWANLEPGQKVLEPSAGHGAIARWAPTTVNATAIEPSSELSSRLAMIFDGEVKRENFEDLHIVNKYDAVVMNPPFGTAGRTAIDHLDKATKHLKDGGRVIAIIPMGSASQKFDKWYEEVENIYMVAEILLPQVTFERAG
ncbi:MAG: hypothetical protein E4H01_03970, partial [Lysobacterales bacterium]